MSGLRRFRWNSFYAKLLGTYLLLAALGTSLLAGYILWFFRDYFIQSRKIDLRNWTNALSESVADALSERDIQQVQVLIERYGAPETITLRVLNAQGQLISSSNPSIDRQVTDWRIVPGVALALKRQSAEGIAKGLFSADDRLYIAKPIIRNGELLGVLRVSITLSQFQKQFTQVIWTVLGTLLLTILLCTLLSERLAKSISQPIETMRNFAIRLGSGQFGDQLTIYQSDELNQLAIELNRMSERLASLDQERKSFLANVSHELRTPISNVQVTVEALRNGAIEEPALRDRFLQTVEDETKRLTRLVHDLLDLGRLEAGVAQLDQQIISLQGLVYRAVNSMEPRMQKLGISVQLNLTKLSLYADPERLLQAILNVLDNAIKHSETGSTIFISIYKEGRDAVIKIQDQGTGIQAKDLPHIFEQFYTQDPARQGSSNGLGLSITKRIVEAHKGTITAQNAAKGAVFTISIPMSKAKELR